MDCSTFAFDLHVLGTPPALILSQDQTLMLKALPSTDPPRAYARRGLAQGQLFNARPIGFCVVQSVFNVVVTTSRLRTD